MPPRDRRPGPANAHISRRVLVGAKLVLAVLILTWAYAIGGLVGAPELVDLVRRAVTR